MRLLNAAYAAVLSCCLFAGMPVAAQEAATVPPPVVAPASTAPTSAPPTTAPSSTPPATAPSTTAPSAATSPLAATDPAAAPEPRAIDAADLSAYADGLIQAAMLRDKIAGVTVSIVDRQGPLLLRGYGVAGVSPTTPVDPSQTLFRIASISKTFTYLLGLKLVEAGKLDLEKPINAYLPADLQVPDDGYPPVLVRHLFTHTAGYEDSAMGHLFVDRADRVTSLEQYIQQHRPARVREPGTRAVYSNYSLALLGVLVAHLNGTDFDTLVERELFAPMQMTSTTFREPLSDSDSRNAGAAFTGRWSQGFKRGGGGYKPQVFEYIAQVGPVGGASSTAADMGRYMRMLLRGGELDGTQVLTPAEYARLRSPPLFRNAKEVSGFSYGFFNTRYGQVETLGHGGATSWFHSGMTVAPELGVGIFISTNTDTGRRFAGQFAGLILERYFENARAAAVPAVPAGFDASRFVGKYNSDRSNHRSAEKVFLSTTQDVAAADDQSLVITSNGESSRWIPEGGLVFREAEGQGRISFFENDKGEITGYASALGHNAFTRVQPLSVLDNWLLLLTVTGVLALLVLVGAWLRRGRREQVAPAARRAAFWLYVSAFAWLAWVVAVLVYLKRATGDETAVFYGYPGVFLPVLLWTAPLLMLLSLVNILLLWPFLRARGWGFWRKSRHLVVVAVFALAAWSLWAWNFVGWKL